MEQYSTLDHRVSDIAGCCPSTFQGEELQFFELSVNKDQS